MEFVNVSNMKFLLVLMLGFLSAGSFADGMTSSLYLCAKELNKIHSSSDRGDLLLVEDDIVISSVIRVHPQSLAIERRLIVMNISGVYEYGLPSTNEVSVRIDVPHRDPRRGDISYFFKYEHGKDQLRSVSYFSSVAPGYGEAKDQFTLLPRTQTSLGESVKSIVSLIDQKVRWIDQLVMSFKLPKKQLTYGNLSLCKNIAVQFPTVNQRIGQFVFRLEGLSPFMHWNQTDNNNRIPASL
ncbi:MAG: hypothetical protein KDD61_16740 [Bdellovibrionales bacterium]|nr:hypothetical protein [Bdellovibrionales bacterium]